MLRIFASLSLGLILSVHAWAQCSVRLEKANDSPSVRTKKVEYALAVISDTVSLAKDPSCVTTAIQYLGENHVSAAIPRLAELVDYAVPTPQCEDHGDGVVGGVGTGCGPKGPYPWMKYPALDALHRIGKRAVPALVEVIAATDEESVKSKNALYALMDLNREHPDEVVPLLKRAAQTQKDSSAQGHLQTAIDRINAGWCQYPGPPCMR